MHVFVAGATGVIGRRAVRDLVDAGHEVTAMARTDTKAELVRGLGATPVQVDLFDPPRVREAVRGHDTVVNLATKIPPMSKFFRAKAWAENDRIRIEGSQNLVDSAIAGGAHRYIQESIAFLYDDHGNRWIHESEPLADSPFTEAVKAAEASAERFCASGGTGVALRFGMFYAGDARHTRDLLKYARRGLFALPGPSGSFRPNIHADDAAQAVVAALGVEAGVYNVTDDQPLTLGEVSGALAGIVGKAKLRGTPAAVQQLAARRAPSAVSSQRVSNALFRDSTGWSTRYPNMTEGLASLIADHRSSVT